MALGLLAVVVLFTWLFSATQHQIADAQGLEPDECLGDEVISFAPTDPRVDEELLVAVTSARRHRGVYLAGSERPTFVREFEGRQGWVWTWTVTVAFQGPHRFQFFADATTFCAEALIEVGPSARPRPTATATPRTFSFAGADNGGNDSGDNDDRDNGDSDNGSSAATPRISSISPSVTCPGGQLTILGRGFGNSRDEVNGEVRVSGIEAQAYLDWDGDEVVILVPNGATIGASQSVYLITDGGFSQTSVTIGPSPCGS